MQDLSIKDYPIFMILKLLFISIVSFGSIMPVEKQKLLQSGFNKKNRYFNKGHFLGGQYSKNNILLDLRRKFYPKKNVERLIFENQSKRFAFFHLTKESQSSHVLFLNIGSKLSKNISHDELEQRVIKSPLIKHVEVTTDPFDGNLNVVLSLSKGVVFEVFEMVKRDKPGRLVLDLMLQN